MALLVSLVANPTLRHPGGADKKSIHLQRMLCLSHGQRPRAEHSTWEKDRSTSQFISLPCVSCWPSSKIVSALTQGLSIIPNRQSTFFPLEPNFFCLPMR